LVGAAIVDETNILAGLAFVLIASIPITFLYLRYRAQVNVQITIRAAIDKGLDVSPELLQQLMAPSAPAVDRRLADLRRGIVATALGIAIAMIGISIGDVGYRVGPAIGALPFMMGLAYIGLWKLTSSS
jgi:hypothetical protein